MSSKIILPIIFLFNAQAQDVQQHSKLTTNDCTFAYARFRAKSRFCNVALLPGSCVDRLFVAFLEECKREAQQQFETYASSALD